MKKIFRKTISIFLLMAVVVSNLPLGTIVAGVRPSVAISSPSTKSVEEGSSVRYTITFSYADRINDVKDYINLNGFDATVSVSGSGNTRTVTLSNVQGTAGKKTISLDSGLAKNDNGNSYETPNSESFTLVEKQVVDTGSNNNNNNTSVVDTTDKVRPSVAVSAPSKKTVDVGGTVSYTVTFADNKAVSKVNLTRDYVVLNGFSATVNISGNGNTRTITLSNVQGTAGKKSIVIKAGAAADAAGNVTLESVNSESFTLAQKQVVDTGSNNNNNNNNTPSVDTADKVRPSIAISAPTKKTIKAGQTVSYTVTFADNKGISKVNLTADYVILNGFTADIKITGSGNTRTITLSNVQGIGGKKNIIVKAGAAEDAAGNLTFETPNSESFTLNVETTVVDTTDKVRPSIAISNPSVKEIYAGGTVSYVVTFADNREIAKINLTEDYLVFNGFTADVKITGNGNTRTITLSNIQGEVGTKYNIVIKKGAAEDAAGNLTFESPNSESFRIVKKANVETPEQQKPTTSSKLDNEPNTGVESLPVLPIMGGAAVVLVVAGYVITKKIYG